jgi:hypothetical protein
MALLRVPAAQNRSLRMARALCLSLLALAVGASCSSAKDTEATVPSRPGAVQPDTSGTPIDETSACSQLSKAESSARSALGCDAVKLTCPDSIRPAGGEGCFVYDQDSINKCATLFDTFTSCDDFDKHPCLVTAVSHCTTGGYGEAGMAGMAGTAGAAALPGEGGGGAADSSSAGAGG